MNYAVLNNPYFIAWVIVSLIAIAFSVCDLLPDLRGREKTAKQIPMEESDESRMMNMVGIYPNTNGDKIRQMTNEELAETISKNNCERCAYEGTNECDERPCDEGILEFLNQEVSNDRI